MKTSSCRQKESSRISYRSWISFSPQKRLPKVIKGAASDRWSTTGSVENAFYRRDVIINVSKKEQ